MKLFMNKNSQYCVLMLLVLLSINTAVAVPQSMNYQGYLSDPTGVPVNVNETITFSIYTLNMGGTPLWVSTQAVTVDKGLFSVQLGDINNPFPANLFDTSLWLGVTVGSDNEMLPRKPFQTSAYSFKADDADTVGGLSVAVLDQSLHVGNQNNPHNVSASQIGAAAQTQVDTNTSTLSALSSDVSSLNTKFSGHIAAPSSHHSRYTDTEVKSVVQTTVGIASNANPINHVRYNDTDATIAMGAQLDSNSLNHKRFTNNDAINAVLAADGAGSNLDADTLDGLQANEIISAASDETRTPIISLPYTISTSGSYYLVQDLLITSGDAINISVDNVEIDLNGYSLTGGATTTGIGVNVNSHKYISVFNGTIKDFGTSAVLNSADNLTISVNTVRSVNVINNGNGLIVRNRASEILNGGIRLWGHGNVVENCRIVLNGGKSGIALFSDSLIKNNVVLSNTGMGVSSSSGSVVSNNVVRNNTIGIHSSNSIIKNNISTANSLVGIRATNSSVMSNVSNANGEEGFLIARSIFKDNTANRNTGLPMVDTGNTSIKRDNMLN
jgi:hypothetical protein